MHDENQMSGMAADNVRCSGSTPPPPPAPLSCQINLELVTVLLVKQARELLSKSACRCRDPSTGRCRTRARGRSCLARRRCFSLMYSASTATSMAPSAARSWYGVTTSFVLSRVGTETLKLALLAARRAAHINTVH